MNLCRRCESEYEKPGTCNCFAEAPMVVVHPGTVVPHYWHPVSPYYVSPFGTMNPPNTCGSGDTITVSGGGPVTGNWTTVEQAEAFGGSTPTFMLSPPKNYPCEIVPVVEYDRQH